MTSSSSARLCGAERAVAVPDVPWEHEGPRPTVVVAPGTVGQADKCAPSETFGEEGGGQIDQVEPLLEQGFRVVVTDYIGLGAPGVHTYVNRVDQGQTVLDAARAGLMVAGYEVPHLHVHVWPSNSLRDFDLDHKDQNPDQGELDEAAEKIRAALRDAGHGEHVPQT